MANNTAPPFNFMAQYIDTKTPSGFSFVGQQQFAAIQQELANLRGGQTVTVPLPALTPGGKAGSLTITNGLITAVVDPT